MALHYKSFFAVAVSPKNAGVKFAGLIFIFYAIVPLWLHLVEDLGVIYLELAILSVFSAIIICIGYKTTLFDRLVISPNRTVTIDGNLFNKVLWLCTLLFATTAWLTADQVPLIAALRGADTGTLNLLREQFLKARGGLFSSFVYINAVLTGALIPYSLSRLFLLNKKAKWSALVFFLLYCVSFMEKAFFFKAVIPLYCLASCGKTKIKLSPRTLLLVIIIILLIVTFLAGSGTKDDDGTGSYFSINHQPSGPVKHLVWRMFAVPIFTAADSLRVHDDEFSGELLYGATSRFFSTMFGMKRVEFERVVFYVQGGQNETGTGSANAVYFVEAFVNFGWLGVALFSYAIGAAMRVITLHRDEAVRAMWPLFAYYLYISGLIGSLFSNGFILIILFSSVVRIK